MAGLGSELLFIAVESNAATHSSCSLVTNPIIMLTYSVMIDQ